MIQDDHASKQYVHSLKKREAYQKPQIVNLGILCNVIRGTSGVEFDTETFTPDDFGGGGGGPIDP